MGRTYRLLYSSVALLGQAAELYQALHMDLVTRSVVNGDTGPTGKQFLFTFRFPPIKGIVRRDPVR
jgi:hypothetical protein